ncbi:uncharacterized protein LOC116613968 [Nematostella vectensis]|uniref:uncharacterized protein LOC116613968 n=1 Tax=Nematostella vectensis TaxID=45351 RepID=UPI0020775EEB|nr:uncharacterized protein LOC116613968 [Nematostella vectensis]
MDVEESLEVDVVDGKQPTITEELLQIVEDFGDYIEKFMFEIVTFLAVIDSSMGLIKDLLSMFGFSGWKMTFFPTFSFVVTIGVFLFGSKKRKGKRDADAAGLDGLGDALEMLDDIIEVVDEVAGEIDDEGGLGVGDYGSDSEQEEDGQETEKDPGENPEEPQLGARVDEGAPGPSAFGKAIRLIVVVVGLLAKLTKGGRGKESAEEEVNQDVMPTTTGGQSPPNEAKQNKSGITLVEASKELERETGELVKAVQSDSLKAASLVQHGSSEVGRLVNKNTTDVLHKTGVSSISSGLIREVGFIGGKLSQEATSLAGKAGKHSLDGLKGNPLLQATGTAKLGSGLYREVDFISGKLTQEANSAATKAGVKLLSNGLKTDTKGESVDKVSCNAAQQDGTVRRDKRTQYLPEKGKNHKVSFKSTLKASSVESDISLLEKNDFLQSGPTSRQYQLESGYLIGEIGSLECVTSVKPQNLRTEFERTNLSKTDVESDIEAVATKGLFSFNENLNRVSGTKDTEKVDELGRNTTTLSAYPIGSREQIVKGNNSKGSVETGINSLLGAEAIESVMDDAKDFAGSTSAATKSLNDQATKGLNEAKRRTGGLLQIAVRLFRVIMRALNRKKGGDGASADTASSAELGGDAKTSEGASGKKDETPGKEEGVPVAGARSADDGGGDIGAGLAGIAASVGKGGGKGGLVGIIRTVVGVVVRLVAMVRKNKPAESVPAAAETQDSQVNFEEDSDDEFFDAEEEVVKAEPRTANEAETLQPRLVEESKASSRVVSEGVKTSMLGDTSAALNGQYLGAETTGTRHSVQVGQPGTTSKGVVILDNERDGVDTGRPNQRVTLKISGGQSQQGKTDAATNSIVIDIDAPVVLHSSSTAKDNARSTERDQSIHQYTCSDNSVPGATPLGSTPMKYTENTIQGNAMPGKCFAGQNNVRDFNGETNPGKSKLISDVSRRVPGRNFTEKNVDCKDVDGQSPLGNFENSEKRNMSNGLVAEHDYLNYTAQSISKNPLISYESSSDDDAELDVIRNKYLQEIVPNTEEMKFLSVERKYNKKASTLRTVNTEDMIIERPFLTSKSESYFLGNAQQKVAPSSRPIISGRETMKARLQRLEEEGHKGFSTINRGYAVDSDMSGDCEINRKVVVGKRESMRSRMQQANMAQDSEAFVCHKAKAQGTTRNDTGAQVFVRGQDRVASIHNRPKGYRDKRVAREFATLSPQSSDVAPVNGRPQWYKDERVAHEFATLSPRSSDVAQSPNNIISTVQSLLGDVQSTDTSIMSELQSYLSDEDIVHLRDSRLTKPTPEHKDQIRSSRNSERQSKKRNNLEKRLHELEKKLQKRAKSITPTRKHSRKDRGQITPERIGQGKSPDGRGGAMSPGGRGRQPLDSPLQGLETIRDLLQKLEKRPYLSSKQLVLKSSEKKARKPRAVGQDKLGTKDEKINRRRYNQPPVEDSSSPVSDRPRPAVLSYSDVAVSLSSSEPNTRFSDDSITITEFSETSSTSRMGTPVPSSSHWEDSKGTRNARYRV